ncbi:hypothetical protein LYZ37_23130 (plasmid) [Vibrio tubiashii]|uniref:hypothetical protein n=1 Tax=Vibrio tubiashii TaxID=29498 RepID=UPI00234F4248|nr:hypothetical protein [Vibrio tubiashii]WCP70323.1 hypothetical protein LYZ37_23130 [Vibrio tubiashii]
MSKIIYAIKDTHSEAQGRELARAQLSAGTIDVFFIEWPHPINLRDVAGSFSGIANDARPTLIDLVKLAIEHDIPVVPCDLTVDQTVESLNKLDDGYGPYNEASAFQPWGKAMRDKHVAVVINNTMLENPEYVTGLVMFGADHFQNEEGRNADTLDVLIYKRSCIDVELLN